MNQITCVYCGQAYPAETPASGEDVAVLTDHIRICEKHPMRKVESERNLLRKALAALVSADTAEELELMEAMIRSMNVPEQDRVTSLNAVHALQMTLQ